ncbi:MAG: hypothetical protein UR98_C0022G0007 [Parcubacteria group bacterium GW2011_GWA1_36_12]|nr:MAG: hypothetical protein UR98_C0022G0007 [Parcubacteria group bacterium GW2011_GWA1_36_12]
MMTYIHALLTSAIFNVARRQSIPAFIERGVWKIEKCDTI